MNHGDTYTSGTQANVEATIYWNVPPSNTPPWPKGQRWFVRLDEWHHAHQPPILRMAWFWLWRPLCNHTERYYQKL